MGRPRFCLDRHRLLDHVDRPELRPNLRSDRPLGRWDLPSPNPFRCRLDRIGLPQGLDPLGQLLTATGEAIWWELGGRSVLPIHPKRIPHRMLSRGGSFGDPTDKPAALFAWPVRNLGRLIEELQFYGVRAGRVMTWVGYRDGRAGEGRSRLVAPSDRFDVLLDAFRPCLRQSWIPRAAAQRMHLFADKLTPVGDIQLALFDRGSEREGRVTTVKREVNDRHGRFSLRSAATLPLVDIYRDAANQYDICDVRGKVCS